MCLLNEAGPVRAIFNTYFQASSCVSKQRTIVNIIAASITYTTTGECFFTERPGYGLSMLVWLHYMVHWSDDMTDEDRWMVHPNTWLLFAISICVTKHWEQKSSYYLFIYYTLFITHAWKDMLNHYHNMNYKLKTRKHKVRLSVQRVASS